MSLLGIGVIFYRMALIIPTILVSFHEFGVQFSSVALMHNIFGHFVNNNWDLWHSTAAADGGVL